MSRYRCWVATLRPGKAPEDAVILGRTGSSGSVVDEHPDLKVFLANRNGALLDIVMGAR